MAIVKAYFTRSSGKIKKTLHYIVHRPGREGEKLNRELFGHTEESIRMEDAYRRLTAGEGMTFFHLKINFHPQREDTRKDLNLRDITRQSMMALEERLQRPIRFLAVEHNDHTPLRHIHAIVLVKLGRGERIGIEDWKACREVATEQARLQRRALDVVRHFQRDMQQERNSSKSLFSRSSGMAGGRAIYTRGRSVRTLPIPHPCPQCDGVMRQALKTLKNGKKWCPIHGVIREQNQRLIPENDQGLGR
jgi:hypothetical protein